MIFRKVILILPIWLIASLSGCAEKFVEINSYPEKAMVSVIENNGQVRMIGETPLKLETSDVFLSGNVSELTFSKDGFEDQKIYISKSDIPTQIKVSQKLHKKEETSSKDYLNNEKLQKLVSRVAEAQRYSFNKQYPRAQDLLEDVLKDYPDLGVGHDLLANIYYLTNQKTKALFHYSKAKAYSDPNSKRDAMIQSLEIEVGR